MKVLKTPRSAFEGLPEYPFADHAVDVGGVDMHYVCEGPSNGPVVVLMHGQPSWSYLYRRTIPRLAAAGYRVYAPDLIGFGRSDKPDAVSDYTYARHVEWCSNFITRLDLRDVTYVLHDWGGSIGLRVAAQAPERLARIVAANTGMVDGNIPLPQAWKDFRDTVAAARELKVSDLVRGLGHKPLPEAVAAAYDAPYPTEAHKAGVRAFPTLVPATPDCVDGPAVRAAWEVLCRYTRPFLTVYGPEDAIYAGAESFLIGAIPGAQGQAHALIEDAGHFLQEDAPEAFTEHLLNFLKTTGARSGPGLTTGGRLEAIAQYAGSKCRRDADSALRDVTEDFVLDVVTLGVRVEGREAVRAQLEAFFATFPDYDAEIERQVTGEEEVVFYCTESGTMGGTFLGLEPTGRRAEFPTTSLYTFRDGKLASEVWFFSLASLCEQLGLSLDAVVAAKNELLLAMAGGSGT